MEELFLMMHFLVKIRMFLEIKKAKMLSILKLEKLKLKRFNQTSPRLSNRKMVARIYK
jgi:hypothetical protein